MALRRHPFTFDLLVEHVLFRFITGVMALRRDRFDFEILVEYVVSRSIAGDDVGMMAGEKFKVRAMIRCRERAVQSAPDAGTKTEQTRHCTTDET